MRCVRQPFCDESGVGFAAHLAENSMLLWSHHSNSAECETWLPEWSGNLGGVQAVAEFGRVGYFGVSQSFGYRRQTSWLKVWLGGG